MPSTRSKSASQFLLQYFVFFCFLLNFNFKIFLLMPPTESSLNFQSNILYFFPIWCFLLLGNIFLHTMPSILHDVAFSFENQRWWHKTIHGDDSQPNNVRHWQDAVLLLLCENSGDLKQGDSSDHNYRQRTLDNDSHKVFLKEKPEAERALTCHSKGHSP